MAWAESKIIEDGVKPQSMAGYERAWRLHGAQQFSELRIGELTTSRADAHLKTLAAGPSTQLRTVLAGMLSMAVRFDVVRYSPIQEARAVAKEKKQALSLTDSELEQGARGSADLLRAESGSRKAGGGRGAAEGVDAPRVRRAARCDLRSARRGVGHSLARGRPARRSENRDSVGDASGSRRHSGEAAAPAELTQARRSPAHGALAGVRRGGSDRIVRHHWQRERSGSRERERWLGIASSISKQFRRALEPYPDLRWVTPHSFRRSVATVVARWTRHRGGAGPTVARAAVDDREALRAAADDGPRRPGGAGRVGRSGGVMTEITGKIRDWAAETAQSVAFTQFRGQ